MANALIEQANELNNGEYTRIYEYCLIDDEDFDKSSCSILFVALAERVEVIAVTEKDHFPFGEPIPGSRNILPGVNVRNFKVSASEMQHLANNYVTHIEKRTVSEALEEIEEAMKDIEEDIHDARFQCIAHALACTTQVAVALHTGGLSMIGAPLNCGIALYLCTWGIDRFKMRLDRSIAKYNKAKAEEEAKKKEDSEDSSAGNSGGGGETYTGDAPTAPTDPTGGDSGYYQGSTETCEFVHTETCALGSCFPQLVKVCGYS